MHLIDANKVDQQIQTHYMLWAIRNVKEMHPTIGSKLNWDKKKKSLIIYFLKQARYACISILFQKKNYVNLDNKTVYQPPQIT